MEVVASVPGNVLVAGGYLVLECPNTGLVLSTTSRFYAIVRPTTAAEEEAHLLRLEEKAEHGGGGAWEYLSLPQFARTPPSSLWPPSSPPRPLRLNDARLPPLLSVTPLFLLTPLHPSPACNIGPLAG
ncbi:hypothetical protein ZWY2020_038267 [Hordeum vulgare]|nr:hypothetical protein ZWY2020_038267 [Hordeum vulgare]